MKALDVEFLCPIPTKKHLKVQILVENKNNLKSHLINNPVITTCCRNSVCLKCMVDQVLTNQKATKDEFTRCCFCRHKIALEPTSADKRDPSTAQLLPNKNLRALIDQ